MNSMLRRTIAAIVVLLLSAAAGFAITVATPKTSRVSSFVVKPDASARTVAAALKREGIIKSSFSFRILARISGLARNIKAGEYDLSGTRNQWQVLKLMASGKVRNYIVTVPEGFTVGQIAELLDKSGVTDGKAFAGIALSAGEHYQLATASMEGFLFPDTYRIPRGEKPGRIVRLMYDRFQYVTRNLDIEGAAAGRGMTAHQIIVIASLVESEARLAAERPVIASVIYNRLAGGMMLECDATVQYALPQRKERLLYKDLKVDSPYNTYLHYGLPPGPIASPGLASIKAALKPDKTDYLFYVARPDGSHIFSRNYTEHLQAISSIRQKGDSQ